MAYCSLHDSVGLIRYMWNGMLQGQSIEKGHLAQGNKALNEFRIHPTQKPITLYEWLLSKYANKGDKILDTHVGSASSLTACHRGGFDCVGFELDKDYYDMASKRLEIEKAQTSIFDFIER